MGGHWFGNTLDDRIKRDLDEIASIGLTWMRLDWPWSGIEQRQGFYYLDKRVEVAGWARDLGIRTLPILGYTPLWARQDAWRTTAYMPPRRDAYDDWARFVVRCVQAGKTVGINKFEDWNESGGHEFWKVPSPTIHGAMMRAMRGPARQANPDVRFVFGAFAPGWKNRDGEFLTAVSYMQQLYAAGYKDIVDAVSYHPYAGGVPVSQLTGRDWDMMTTQRKKLEDVMAANGHANRKVWSTEFGYGTAGPYHPVSEANQAKYLVEQIDFLRKLPTAGPVFLFNWREMGDPKIGFNSYGITKQDYSHKPAVAAIRELLT